MKKHIFQIVQKNDGTRSLEFILTAAELAKVLAENGTKETNDETYVLVLADIGEDNLPLFSTCPMMLATTFINMFHLTNEHIESLITGASENVRENV